ncbi:MAG TPA: amidohydrolase family protein [Bryobacteraceae bacterium]|jgi:imidazolonepropionase-like amidohydrolase|nr:amidohydrolase family protein [Bryobacteraceae bacterium]
MRIAIFFLITFAIARARAETFLIKNATVMTVSKGKIENGSVLVENGKIAAVGHDITAPAHGTVIDATGMFLTPGLIDCHSHTAIEGNVNEGSVSDAAMVNVKDVINPYDVNIYRALAGGLTVSNVLHGSANAIGGQTVVIKLRWGKDAEGMLFAGAVPGIKFALGENPKRQGYPRTIFSGPNARERRYPGTRLGVEDVIREDFTKAKIYQQEWAEYNARIARGENPIPPRRDLQLEPLVEVLEGKRYLHCHSYRSDELLMLMKLSDEIGFKIRTFQHALEAYKVAKEIAARHIGVSTFSDWWSYKIEVVDAIPYNAAICVRKGIVTSLNSDSDELQRHLNYEAAKTMRYGGLTEEEALSLVTLSPAKQLGIDKRVGSIDVGKDADLVLWNKYPLSNYSKAMQVWIDGTKYFDVADDLKARADVAAKKKVLLEKEKARQESDKKKAPSGPKNPKAPGEVL